MIQGVINKIKLSSFRKKWRKKNKDNTTIAGNIFDLYSVSVGEKTYGCINVLNYSDKEKLKIGNFCSIAQNVLFILNADHYVNHISTFPFKVKVKGDRFEGVSKGDIIVDDDVWIGYDVTVLSGVKIGKGAVIAAGAVVTKDVPPYSIVGGVPAKLIKYRFEPEIIDYLDTLDYSSLTEEMINKHIEDLYVSIDEMNIEGVSKLYEWFPKK